MSVTSYLRQGPRVAIRRVCRQDYDELTALARESAEMLRRWVGARENTVEGFESYLGRIQQPTHEGFVICLRDAGTIVGGVNINNIVRGALQSGTLGYTSYASTTGRGYMTEGLGLVVQLAFGPLELHRLEANIQPDNTPSLNLVKRLGFRREGYSTAFQYIDGEWRDHERWAITAEMTRTAAQLTNVPHRPSGEKGSRPPAGRP
ncbi:GNAT family N-acetyltransferase [Embleya scabrispora]|uniref:GNAT family N-acetyltransferase n=1 Tax=Embleya scabrispora TaxID=159449 RepID=UPI0007C4B274|nr:GNAT family protein [Embleya scabrispora]MYS87893.1 GNAT family N-acetyltransferase [Streptomyces sp. SID5474]